MVEKKTTDEQGMHARKNKALVQAAVAFAIIIGAFALEWNIGGLKETDRKAIKPTEEKVVAMAEEKNAVVETQTEKNVVEVKKQLLGGCRNAQDFVNVNILMRRVENFENFEELLGELQFENGKVRYPEVAMNGALLKEMQTFFDKVAVFSEDELQSCVDVLQRARQYNIARLSFNDVKVVKDVQEEG